MVNLLLAQNDPSHLKCDVFGAFVRINTVYCGSSVHVYVSEFQIKGKHLLLVNFGTSLDLHGVHILNL